MFVKSGCIMYFIFGVLPLALRREIVLLFLIEEYKKSPHALRAFLWRIVGLVFNKLPYDGAK